MKQPRRIESRPARPADPETATVSRPALLVDDSDAAFRRMIHALMSYAQHIETIRDGFGALVGVSGVQYELLMTVQRLQQGRGVTVGEVAASMHRSGAFITIESGKLVRAGLIEKAADPADRRRVLLRLTAEARRRLVGLAPRQRQVNDVLFESFAARDFRAFSRILHEALPCGRRAVDLMDFLLKTLRQGAA